MTVSPFGLSPQESELTSLVELNDAEIPKIEAVLRIINTRQGKRTHLDDFQKEIKERFGGIGLKVDVLVREAVTYSNEVIYDFKIVIEGRYEGQFDPDQMVAETTADVLGLGTGGVIKTSGLWTPPGT